jgi:hypothetical protein
MPPKRWLTDMEVYRVLRETIKAPCNHHGVAVRVVAIQQRKCVCEGDFYVLCNTPDGLGWV